MEKILGISLTPNFTTNTLGCCYGLRPKDKSIKNASLQKKSFDECCFSKQLS